MPEEFTSTVDLREKKERESRSQTSNSRGLASAQTPRQLAPKPSLLEPQNNLPPSTSRSRVSTALPRELEVDDKQEFQRIARPVPRRGGLSDRIKNIIWLAVIVAFLLGGYFFWYRPKYANKPVAPEKKWSMVKLVDGEFFYGQVVNESSDPMVIENVYYDYDKLSAAAAAKDKEGNPVVQPEVPSNPTGQIRLVRRGKEPHGPTGSLSIVRGQVLYMEELKPDSKILKTIIADLAKTSQ